MCCRTTCRNCECSDIQLYGAVVPFKNELLFIQHFECDLHIRVQVARWLKHAVRVHNSPIPSDVERLACAEPGCGFMALTPASCQIHRQKNRHDAVVGRGVSAIVYFELRCFLYTSGEARDFEVGGFCKGRGSIKTGSGGRKSPSGVQGQSPGRGSGGRSPPEAERFLLFIPEICHIL